MAQKKLVNPSLQFIEMKENYFIPVEAIQKIVYNPKKETLEITTLVEVFLYTDLDAIEFLLKTQFPKESFLEFHLEEVENEKND